MKTILVPTDFSANSKAGLRFAMYWSARESVKLTFMHVFHISRSPQITDAGFEKLTAGLKSKLEIKLEQFILSLYHSTGVQPGKYSCVVSQSISADLSIMDYCRRNGKISCICISTHGAGRVNKLFGTNTGNLITKSDVPVMAIPKKYRKQKLKSLLYATDLTNSDKELKEVIAFARPLNIRIKFFHLAFPGEVTPEEKTYEKSLRNKFRYDIDVQISRVHIENSVRENIQEQIKISRPSMIVLFTDQHRNFFQKLFYPSKAEQLSFSSTIPLLTFPKN